MRSRTLGRTAWPRLGALFALLALSLVAPSSARAGCGDHAMAGSGSHSAGRAASIELLGPVGPASHGTGGLVPPVPSPSPRPCTGAFCSGSPAVPYVPLPIASDRVDLWAWVAPNPRLGGISFHAFLDGGPGLRPSESRSAIFHPPRARASA